MKVSITRTDLHLPTHPLAQHDNISNAEKQKDTDRVCSERDGCVRRGTVWIEDDEAVSLSRSL